MKNVIIITLFSSLLFMSCQNRNEEEITQIKGDLIGKNIPGWYFDYLSEFKKVDLIEKRQAGLHTEYDLLLTLLDEHKNKTYQMKVRVFYKDEYNHPYFQRVQLLERIYQNPVSKGKWSVIHPLEDCYFSIQNTPQKFILLNPCNGKKFMLGGVNGVKLDESASCDSLYVQSLDNESIYVSFLYRQLTHRE